MQPAVRARNVREALDAVDKFEPGTRAEILERMPVESRRVVLETPAIGWVPIEHDHFVPGGVRDVLGSARGRDFFRQFLPTQLDAPLLGAIMGATRRLFGLNPGSAVWATERAWQLVYRDFCTAKAVERAEGFARLELREFTPEVLDYDAYPFSFEAFFEGVLVAFDTEHGEMNFDLDRTRRQISVTYRW